MAMRAIAKQKGEWTDVRVLIKHPMETGLRKDKKGKLIPAHFIESVIAFYDDTEVVRAYLGPGVSKNPLVRFYVKADKGKEIKIEWKDNKSQTESIMTQVK